MQRITAPGLYEMPADVYHADPCPTPSLSSTGAKKIIAECPARYWYDRNNPPEPSTAFDVGSAAHNWVLEGDAWPGRHHILPEDFNGRTKAGAALMEEILAAGKRPIKAEDFERIKGMRTALIDHEFAGLAFQNGRPEMSLFWRDEAFGIWCRARPDWLPNHGRIIVDYKTARSAEPEDLRKAIYDYGYAQQAAWYCDGVKALGIIRDPQFLFVFQEKEPPYLITCVTLTEGALSWGRILNDKAKDIFAGCLSSGIWPGYADDVISLDFPAWADKRLTELHDAGRFEAARRFQAPAAE